MKGTSFEVLEWITHHQEYAPLMQMTRQRLVGLRHRLSKRTISAAMAEEMLENLKKRILSLQSSIISCDYCWLHAPQKVRDAYVLPAVVRDHRGRFFHEMTFLKMYRDDEQMQDLNLGYVLGSMKRNHLPSKNVVREALNRKGWTIFEERMELPSVWEIES